MCSSRILVVPSAGKFQTAIFKFDVLLSTLCGTKINLKWTNLPFLHLPIMTYPPINIKFFFTPPPSSTPLFNILKTPYTPTPFVNGEEGGCSNYEGTYS